MNFEQSGTISVEAGSTKVTGSGTTWISAYDGVALVVGGNIYPVASIDSTTTLTLTEPFPNATVINSSYSFLLSRNENYQLNKKVQQVLDVAGELIDATVGPQGPAGPAGPTGPAGKNGDAGFGQIVNFSDYKPQPAGGSGVNLLVPVALGDPGLTLTQSATVYLPKDKANAGIGMWVKQTTSAWAITLGLINAPEPQPEVPGEDIDLSGSSTIYGNPGTIFPLGIYLANSSASFTVDVPTTIPVKIKRETPSPKPVSASWRMGGSGAPYPVTGDGVSSDMVMNKNGSGFDFRNGNVVVDEGSYLATGALGLEFTALADEKLTQTPARIRLSFKGVIPADATHAILAEMNDYSIGQISLEPYYSGNTLQLALGRNGASEGIQSDSDDRRVLGTNQLYEAEWVDNVGGEGGWVYFYVDGQQMGERKASTVKPRITPAMPVEINASVGNTSNGISNLEVEYVKVSYDKPDVALSYEDVSDGAISRSDLESLVVDASALGAMEPAYLTYTANGGDPYRLEIIVGEMSLPAGRAYKAVLEDWSTGSGVEHPNHLVMTRPAAQNCRFEDTTLYSSQPSWTEVLPQGAVPNINGINYYCEGVRMGTYVQFQFVYDWDTTTMPANPFGDPTNKNSYMVPHKWKIYDSAGTLLARIEQPNGEPLNNSSRPACWEGQYDGRGVAIITESNRWLPHGTCRSSVVWRSHDPVAYEQQHVWDTVPTYDMRVPFACHTGYSVNGGDARLFSEGQANGFANYRAMSWEPTDTNGIIAQAAASLSPWKALFNPTSVEPNAGIWLKYTPFNQQGRCPITGPGGVRDDRQIMPDMVAEYARNVNSVRPMDNLPMKQIALDYLTGYASDPVHAVENGRVRPLFKGNALRNITMRNHYYGEGQQATPASQAYYVQGGRTYEWMNAANPLRVKVPYGGVDPKKPVFGTNMIDAPHAHQFPHWGSMLFKTPEFAMLGHKFSDQTRLYNNVILNRNVNGMSDRDSAWAFMHAAILWKTASSNSTRLYSRKEVLDWVIFDFETFYDTYYASTPGFLNPPTNIFTDGQVDWDKAMFAASARFGISMYEDSIYTHDFMVGYWLSALHAAQKLGFNDALSDASPKAKAIIDWLKINHRKRSVGRVKDGSLINANEGVEYITPLWTAAQINASGGDVSKLPQSFAEVQSKQSPNAPSWDSFTHNGEVGSRDGQALDQLLAGPALVKDMGFTGSDLDQAVILAEQRFQERLTSETARGADQAGTIWFKFHQVTNNRPYKPS